MAFLFVVMFALNMVQGAKDIQRCQKENFKAKGCSVYVKMNVDKHQK